MKRRTFGHSLLFSLATTAQAQTDLPQNPLQPVIPIELLGSLGQNWLEQGSLLQTIDYSLDYLQKKTTQQHYPAAGLALEQVRESLWFFRQLLRDCQSALEFELRLWHYFDFHRAAGRQGQGDVLFTGYYEPLFMGSLTVDAQFRYPLYRLPSDLLLDRQGNALGRQTDQGVVPYYSRQEIEEGQLLRGSEVVWLDNLLNVFLIHVQGSARLQLPDGQILPVGYAGKTDRPYQSLGKALAASGRIVGDVNLPIIRAFFQQYPDDLKTFLYTNESYVFFKEMPAQQPGPTGSIGVPLTAMRSIALDRQIFPRGALALIDVNRGQALNNFPARFVCNQDTGGAIKGAGRVDIFVGSGPPAEAIAGRLKANGTLYFPVLKPNPLPFDPALLPKK